MILYEDVVAAYGSIARTAHSGQDALAAGRLPVTHFEGVWGEGGADIFSRELSNADY